METVGLRWTGHPLIDMGVAAIIIATDNDTPEEVTTQQWRGLMMDLQQDYLLGVYRKPSYALHHNLFEEPSRTGTNEKSIKARQSFIDSFFESLLLSPKPISQSCTFFPEQKAVLRSARDKVPMLLGKGQLNFYPHGEPELPISPLALGCILALPICTPSISGRLPVLAIDDKNLLLNICYAWFLELKTEYALIKLQNEALKDRKAPKTRLWKTLHDVFSLSSSYHQAEQKTSNAVLASITMYHLSNIGTGPRIDIYTVLPQILKFIRKTKGNLYAQSWTVLINAFWINTSGKVSRKMPDPDKILKLKNAIYEALDQLPDNASFFIRRFFLRFARNRVGVESDIQTQNIDIWPLINLFLMEVLNMSPTRIQKIQSLADALASEVIENNDKSVFRSVLGTTGGDAYGAFRNLLVRTLKKRLERADDLMFTMEDYLEVFESGEEVVVSDWRLARDLIRIRFLESLHRADFFKKEGKELLASLADDASDDEQ